MTKQELLELIQETMNSQNNPINKAIVLIELYKTLAMLQEQEIAALRKAA